MKYSRLRVSALVVVVAAALAATLAGSGSATVAAAPTNSTPPNAHGGTVQGDVVSTNSGSWNGSNINYSYKWETCTDNVSTGTCSDIGGATGSNYQLQASDVGKYVRSLVTATDSGGSASAYSNALGPITAATAPSIGSTPPSISGSASVGHTLTGDKGTWNGTTPIHYAYQWLRCDSSGNSCNNINSATDTTYTVASGDLGSTIRFQVTASNLAGSDQEQSAQSSAVVAGTPVNTAAPTVAGTAQVGQHLTSTNGTWQGTTPITFTYQWQRCDTSGNNCASITGATTSAYTLVAADAGHTIRLAVTATNSAGHSTVSSAPTATIVSGAPINTVAPAVSGTTKVGQTLTVSTGTWTGLTPITFTYQWQRCDANGNNCVSISGATKAAYTVTGSENGAKLIAQVTATNSIGAKTAASNVVGPITSDAPVNTAAPVLSGTPTTGQTLSVTNGNWTGPTPITYAYVWQRCTANASVCSSIPGAIRSTYQLQNADTLAYIRVVVTASNRGGNTAINTNLVGPVKVALPVGAVRLSNGKISVPLSSLPLTDTLRVTTVTATPKSIKHRRVIKITLRVTDQNGYVIRGAKLTLTAAHPTWITRVATRTTPLNGAVTIIIRPTLKAPLKGTLVLRIRALPAHGTRPSSLVKTVKIAMKP